jgi:outer membrane lipoprotein-sorting protein
MAKMMKTLRLICLMAFLIPCIAQAQTPAEIVEAAGKVIKTITDVANAVNEFGGRIAEDTGGVTKHVNKTSFPVRA